MNGEPEAIAAKDMPAAPYMAEPDEALVRRVVARLTYKPGWSFEVERRPFSNTSNLSLIARVDEPNSRNHGQRIIGFTRRAPLRQAPYGYYDHTEAHVMAWVRKAIQEWECHEADEWLRLDGDLWHDPHKCSACLITGCRA